MSLRVPSSSISLVVRQILSSLVLGTALLSFGNTAHAQGAPPLRLRATIDAVAGDTLQMTSRVGEKLSATLSPKATVAIVELTKIEEIKTGSFIGVTSVTQPDGSLKAIEVHVFPEAMRGAGEGHYPWDLGPKSSMTNGTVGNIVGAKGRTVSVAYKGGEQQIVIPDNIPIVTFEPGDRSLLVPGAHVIAFAAKAPDGALTVNRISVGKDGLVPPM